MKKRLILFCVFLFFISACGVDEDEINELAEECAAGDHDACSELADIARSDKDCKVRRVAVEKLTDQKIIAGIAMSDKDWGVSFVAVEKLTDEAALASIALEGNFHDSAALKKLADPAALAKVAVDDKNWRVRLIRKFIAAFDSVPTEHRERLMLAVFPAIRTLSYPAVSSKVGDIVSIKTNWDGTSQYYTGVFIGHKTGEMFTFSIKVRKLTEPLSHTWGTNFPFKTSSLSFLPADVNASDLYQKAFDKLTDK
jgi:hypothetical protein